MAMRRYYNKTLMIFFDLFLFVVLFPIAIFARILTEKTQNLKAAKVFIGLNECTGNIGRLQQTLRKFGVRVRSKSIKYDLYSQFEYNDELNCYCYHVPIAFDNIVLSRIPFRIFIKSFYAKAKDICRIIFKYDLLILNTSIPFLSFCLDYILFWISGVKLIIIHAGDDVRYRPISNHIWKAVSDKKISGLEPLPFSENFSFFFRRLYVQKMAEWFSFRLFTTFEQATFLSRPAFQFNIPIESLTESITKANVPPRILHAPSDPKVKRTDLVIEAIEALKAEGYRFEFTLLRNKRNSDVLKSIKEHDIVIDQPNILFGLLLREAMSAGCAVVGIPTFRGQEHLSEAPVVPFEEDASMLKSTLSDLICNIERLDEIKRASREFYIKTFSEEAFFNYFQDVIEKEARPQVRPLSDQKDLCIRYATDWKQRLAIRLLM